MTSNSRYHKNYTEFGETYQLVLPLNLEASIFHICLLHIISRTEKAQDIHPGQRSRQRLA